METRKGSPVKIPGSLLRGLDVTVVMGQRTTRRAAYAEAMRMGQ